MENTNSFKIENLYFSYGKRLILNNINISIPTGKCYALLGANGCGKSTMISILAGSRKADAGTLTLPNSEKWLLTASKRPLKIGYVPQENPLIPTLNGYDNLLLWFEGNKKDFKKALNSELIKMLGIESYIKRPVSKLSGGMKRRLSLAIGLINAPDLLLLDEPSAALDLPCQMDMLGYLKTYLESGGTILLTTHEENELDICDKLMILKNGTLEICEPGMNISELTSKF